MAVRYAIQNTVHFFLKVVHPTVVLRKMSFRVYPAFMAETGRTLSSCRVFQSTMESWRKWQQAELYNVYIHQSIFTWYGLRELWQITSKHNENQMKPELLLEYTCINLRVKDCPLPIQTIGLCVCNQGACADNLMDMVDRLLIWWKRLRVAPPTSQWATQLPQ